MATYISDGRIIEDDGQGTWYDLTDQARRIVTVLARSEIETVSRPAQDLGNEFGWFDQPYESEDAPASVFLIVQTDEEDGSEASAWVLGQEKTLSDARSAAREMVEFLEQKGYNPEQLEDSAPWRYDARFASTGDPFHAPPGARGPDDPRDA